MSGHESPGHRREVVLNPFPKSPNRREWLAPTAADPGRPRIAPRLLALTLSLSLAASSASPSPAAEGEGAERDHPGPATATTREPVAPVRASATGPAAIVFTAWNGIYGGGAGGAANIPPDPHGAVGSLGILTVVNTHMDYYRRNGGSTIGQIKLDTFFSSGRIVDPHVQYDLSSQRFIVSGMDRTTTGPPDYRTTTNLLRLAVSKTPDPASWTADDWYFYSTSVMDTVGGIPCWGDYPAVGLDSSAVYLTYNMATTTDNSFHHVRIFACDKAALFGGILRVKSIATPTFAFTLQPATVLGSRSPGNVAYFAEVYGGSTTQLRLWALSDPLGNPALSSTFVTVPNHGGAIEGAPQCESGIRIYTWSPRAMGNAVWCDGALWVCHTAGGSSGRSIVFYYKVETNAFPAGSAALAESGGIDGGPGVWNYQPAIGGNSAGDVGLVFTQSSTTQCPTMMATARRANDTGFPSPVVVAESATFYKGDDPVTDVPYARWGDYASVVPDPLDSTLWMCHELSNGISESDRWKTVWANLQIPDANMAWPAGGEAIRSSATTAERPTVIADGNGGSYVAWMDSRRTTPEAYLQHLTASGAAAAGWPPAGMRLGGVYIPDAGKLALAPDGAGGAYVAWASLASLRLIRVTGAGSIAPGWPADGLPLTGTTVSGIQMLAEGAEAVFVVWTGGGLRLQRVTSGGAISWASGGVSLATSGSAPQLAADDSGGVVVVWSPSVRAQRVAPTGVPLWTSGGVVLAPGANSPRVARDGLHGAFVAYVMPDAGGASQTVRMQRVSSSTGSPANGWPAAGLLLTPAGNSPWEIQLLEDGAGGAIAAWTDDRNVGATGLDIYAIRVTSSGATAQGWDAAGLAVCAAPGDQASPAIAPDGDHGAVVTWVDGRDAGDDIYAQLIGSDGNLNPGCPSNGIAVCAMAGHQAKPVPSLVGTGNSVITWEDARLLPDCDLSTPCGTGIYAQRITFDAISPSAVTDLGGVRGVTTAALGWIEPGDDRDTGTATAFDIRISTSAIASDSAFAAAPRITPAPPPQGAGNPACVTATGLTPCTTYYFAVRTVDEAGNWSPRSNLASLTTRCSGVETWCENGYRQEPSAEGEPRKLELAVPKPNPATGDVVVEYAVPAADAGAPMELAIFDVAGRRVATVASGLALVGFHSQRLSAADVRAVRSPGTYYLKLTVGARSVSRVMTLLR